MVVPNGPCSTYSDLRWAQPFQSSGVLDTLFPAFCWLCYSDLPQVSPQSQPQTKLSSHRPILRKKPFSPICHSESHSGHFALDTQGEGRALTDSADFFPPAPQLPAPPPNSPTTLHRKLVASNSITTPSKEGAGRRREVGTETPSLLLRAPKYF